MMSVKILPQAFARSAFFAGSDIASASVARSSNALLQYQDQFQPPCTAPPQPRIGP